MDPDQDVDDGFDLTDDAIDMSGEDVDVESAPVATATSADRYKRRVETRAPAARTGGRGRALAIAAILLAGVVGLLIWLQPWNSTPLDVGSVQNERVDLVERVGANGCFWRFDIEVTNTADERVWITTVELFLNDQVVRPDIAYGFIEPGVQSAIPVDIYLGDVASTGTCATPETIDHSSLEVVHATLGETFTAGTSF